jgi:hypothetical protein
MALTTPTNVYATIPMGGNDLLGWSNIHLGQVLTNSDEVATLIVDLGPLNPSTSINPTLLITFGDTGRLSSILATPVYLKEATAPFDITEVSYVAVANAPSLISIGSTVPTVSPSLAILSSTSPASTTSTISTPNVTPPVVSNSNNTGSQGPGINSSSSSGGLVTVSKTGLGVGLGIGILVVLVLLGLLLVSRRRRNDSSIPTVVAEEFGKPELDGVDTAVSELNGLGGGTGALEIRGSPAELDATSRNVSREVAELDSVEASIGELATRGDTEEPVSTSQEASRN